MLQKVGDPLAVGHSETLPNSSGRFPLTRARNRVCCVSPSEAFRCWEKAWVAPSFDHNGRPFSIEKYQFPIRFFDALRLNNVIDPAWARLTSAFAIWIFGELKF